jgi:hypothetical protein
VDPQEIVALDREIIDVKRNLEQHLVSGAVELTQIRSQIITQRNILNEQVNRAYHEMVQAEADMKAAKA